MKYLFFGFIVSIDDQVTAAAPTIIGLSLYIQYSVCTNDRKVRMHAGMNDVLFFDQWPHPNSLIREHKKMIYWMNWSNLPFGNALVKWSAIFQIPGTCETMNCPCSTRSIIQKNLISMDLDRFAFIVPDAMPRATMLSMRNTVGGCGYPSSARIRR